MMYPIKKDDLRLEEITDDEHATTIFAQAYINEDLSRIETSPETSISELTRRLESWEHLAELKKLIETQNSALKRAFKGESSHNDLELKAKLLAEKAVKSSKKSDAKSDRYLKIVSIAAAFIFVAMSTTTVLSSQITDSGTKSSSKTSQLDSGSSTQDLPETQEEKLTNQTSDDADISNSRGSNTGGLVSDSIAESEKNPSSEGFFDFGSLANSIALGFGFVAFAVSIFFLIRKRRN